MNPIILAVDDSADDTLLLQHACKRAAVKFSLVICNHAEKAIEYLQGNDGSVEPSRMPALLLLDLKMPRKNGLEILGWIRTQNHLKEVKVAIFSSSQNEADICNSYERGADWYFSKPVEFEQLSTFVSHLDHYLRECNTTKLLSSPTYRAPLKRL